MSVSAREKATHIVLFLSLVTIPISSGFGQPGKTPAKKPTAVKPTAVKPTAVKPTAANPTAAKPTEEIFGFAGAFQPLLKDPAACAESVELPEFKAFLNLPGKPAFEATVQTVCPQKIEISSTQIPSGQAPAGGVLIRNGLVPVLFTYDSTAHQPKPAAERVFGFSGDFTAALDNPVACAPSAKLKDFSGYLNLKGKALEPARVQAVCPGKVELSAKIPADQVPEAGLLQRDGKPPFKLVYNASAPKLTPITFERVFSFKADFKKILDDPLACAQKLSVFQGFWYLKDKSLQKGTVKAVCPDEVEISGMVPDGQNPAGGLLQRVGKPPVSFTADDAAQPKPSTGAASAEKIYGADGNFSSLLDNSSECISTDRLVAFRALLTLAGKPIADGTVKAVCPDKAYIASTVIPEGQMPSGGLLQRTGKNAPPIELKFDGTIYKKYLVGVTSPELHSLCGRNIDCANVNPSDIRVVVAPASGLKQGVAGAPAFVSFHMPTAPEGLQSNVAVVSFMASADFKMSMAILSRKLGDDQESAEGIIARPLQGAPAQRVLVSHGNFIALTGDKPGCVTPEELKHFRGIVYAAQKIVNATILTICNNRVYLAADGLDDGEKVVGGLLQRNDGNATVAAVPIEFDSMPYQTFVISVRSREMPTLCGAVCSKNELEHLTVTLVPGPQSVLTGGEDAKVKAIDKDLAVISFVAPVDFQVEYVNILNQEKTNVVSARTLPGPRPVRGQPNVSFTIIAPHTVALNYGYFISTHYIVVDLTIKNPGTKKIQVQKPSVWFEVDYASTASAPGQPKRLFRYGIEHVEQQTAEDWQTVLGVYDGLENIIRTIGPKGLDATLAIVTALSGTAIHSKGLTAVLPKLTGIIAPAFKDLYFNNDVEKRKRSNLLTQGFGDIVQIPAQASVTRKVFLPRVPVDKYFEREDGASGGNVTGKPMKLNIESIRNVHLDLEVVSETLSENVVAGKVAPGMTKDQVVQALGIPDSKKDGKGQISTWTYEKGNYKKVSFDENGKVTIAEARPLTDQLDQLQTSGASTESVKTLLDMHDDPTNVQYLWDGGFIWPNPAGVARTLRFSKDKKLTDSNYVIASDKDKGFEELKDKIASEVETKLASIFPDGKDSRPSKPIKDSGTIKIYNSPDLKGQTVTVTFDKSTKKATEVKVEPTKF